MIGVMGVDDGTRALEACPTMPWSPRVSQRTPLSPFDYYEQILSTFGY